MHNNINHLKVFIIVFLAFHLSMKCHAQDPVFSQFYTNLLYLNPAYAGEDEYAHVFLGYRNQWPGFNNAYVNYYGSYDQYIHALHGGVGIGIMNERMGDGIVNRIGVDAMYAYHLEITRDFTVNAALQVSFNHKALNPGKLVFPDMIDPDVGIEGGTTEILFADTRNYFDFSTGIVTGYKNIYGGLAMHHLNRPPQSFSPAKTNRLPLKYSLHGGINIPLQMKYVGKLPFILSPNIIFQSQEGHKQLNYGAYLSKEPLYFGVWLRNDLSFSMSSVIFSVGFHASNYRFGYSYDYNLKKSATNFLNSGSHEVTFLINFQYNEKRNKMRAIKCPKL